MRFRKKTHEIEAFRFMGLFSYEEMIEAWGASFKMASNYCPMKDIIEVGNPMGEMKAVRFDWVIKNQGQYFVMKSDVFEMLYEQIG